MVIGLLLSYLTCYGNGRCIIDLYHLAWSYDRQSCKHWILYKWWLVCSFQCYYVIVAVSLVTVSDAIWLVGR